MGASVSQFNHEMVAIVSGLMFNLQHHNVVSL